MAKVQRLASTLEKFGMKEKASALRNDRAILLPETFNPVKAWIEYINRIFGVVAGLLGVWFLLLAIAGGNRRSTKVFVVGGFLMLVLNAWLGSIVVATNLLPGIVTVHFLLSFFCVFLFMLAINNEIPFSSNSNLSVSKWKWILLFVLVVSEVLLGTAAREKVESMVADGTSVAADGMLDYVGMGTAFFVHRYLPGIILIISVLFAYQENKMRFKPSGFYLLAALVFLQIAFGAVNIVFVLPWYSQVVHIALGSLLPVLCFYYLLMAFHKNRVPSKLEMA